MLLLLPPCVTILTQLYIIIPLQQLTLLYQCGSGGGAVEGQLVTACLTSSSQSAKEFMKLGGGGYLLQWIFRLNLYVGRVGAADHLSSVPCMCRCAEAECSVTPGCPAATLLLEFDN